jgi:hypothetical protein
MSTLSLKRYDHPLIYDGIVAGLTAGAIVDCVLLATGMLKWPTSYNFIASALVGKVAFTSSAYVPLGIALHFVISGGWGAIFGLAAQRYRQLVAHPTTSGLVFGLIVLIVMQLLLVVAGMWQAPQSAGQVIMQLVAHTAFFGLPIAWYVNRAARRASTLRTA